MANKVLEGVRVVDWTIAQSGSKAASWLAALGAEVIHVETPGVGDPQRYPQPLQGVPTMVGDGLSSLFESVNFNKKSLTLDLNQEEGRKIVYQLVGKADVFVTNQLPDTVEQLAMNYDTLNRYNPRLIYAVTTLVGYHGASRNTPERDVLGQAAGIALMTTGVRGQPPTPTSYGYGEMEAATALFGGVMSALLYRQRTGRGQRVDTSQMQALMNIPASAALALYSMLSEEQRRANPYGGQKRPNPRDGNVSASGNYYRCKDGKWVHLGANSEKYFVNLAKAIGRPDLLEDPRFADAGARIDNNKELIKIFDETIAQFTLAEWMERFKGVDTSFYSVLDLPNLPEHPQVVANDMMLTFEHPQLGPVKLPGLPFNLGKSPAKIVRGAPQLGEHTEEVLLDLGHSRQDIAHLREKGVI